jgi:hypothetical protein
MKRNLGKKPARRVSWLVLEYIKIPPLSRKTRIHDPIIFVMEPENER